MDKNQRHPLSQITKMKLATFVNKGAIDYSCFVNKGVIDGSYIVETRHAKTSQQKTCHCLGLSEIAQIMEADKDIQRLGAQTLASVTKSRRALGRCRSF